MKFGGSSVDGPHRMRSVAQIVVGRLAEKPVVVTSAMAGVTNLLVRLLDQAIGGDREGLEQGFRELEDRHLSAAAALAPGDEGLTFRLTEQLRELRVLLRGMRLVGAATPRSSDAVLGFGEQLAQELLAAALAGAGAATRVVDSRAVVITDDHFGSAQPDIEETTRRSRSEILPLVEQGLVPVLGGYLGATTEGVPTTLGRGGSDLSASVLGLALSVSEVEIWTDVDGMLTADPRIVPTARLISRVTLREAAELAGFGAKVLHPASIDPAIQGGIDVLIRNSLAPDRAGTRIGPYGTGGDAVRSIAHRGNLELIRVRAPGRARSHRFLPEVLLSLGDDGMLPLLVSTGPLGVELLLPAGPGLERIVHNLGFFGSVFREPGLGMAVAVGEKLDGCPELLTRILSAASGLPVKRIGQGPRGSSLVLVVPEERLVPLVRTLHQALIEGVA